MTLYEIDQAIQYIVNNAIDAETGEILDEDMTAKLDELQMAREQKCENIACWIKDLTADAKAIREEEKALADRRRIIENKTERLKAYLRYALNGDKLATPRCSVSYRKSQQVDVMLLDVVPEEFLRFKDPEPDKTKIKDALKAGENVPGCALVETVSMIIK